MKAIYFGDISGNRVIVLPNVIEYCAWKWSLENDVFYQIYFGLTDGSGENKERTFLRMDKY